MKKILILIIILTTSQFLYSQTYKSGTISSPETWSGTIYLADDVTITSTVTINASTQVLFKENDITLTVDGSGLIDANGTSGNEIYFSADHDEDGNYGESAANNDEGDFDERGLKFKFYPSSGSSETSTLDYCVIEYIDCSNESGGTSYGALDIVRGTVEINFCTLRYNKAGYGGAIFLRNTSDLKLDKSILEDNEANSKGGALYSGAGSGLIQNCLFLNNSAISGGAIYIYLGSTIIENCLIYSNDATSNGSGVFLNKASSSAELLNCTIADNSKSGNERDFQYSGETGKLPSIINTIVWGSDIGTLNSDYISVNNSAIQGFTNPEDHTASFSLSADNNASNGPNFSATDGSDWSIKFISPCRDSGTDSGAPSTDYDGNSRIGATDIGTFEVQYSLWDGSEGTFWSTDANWEQNINPGSSGSDVIIPSGLSNYPTSTGTSFTISSNNHLILEPGAQLTLGTLTNNGMLRLESDASGISSLMVDTYTDSGTEEIELFLTGGSVGASYKWHYISSPVTNLSTNIFTGTTQNLVGYFEERPETSDMEGWVAFDGYVYYDGSDDDTYLFSTLNVGEGYNLYCSAEHTFSFPGTINTGNISIPLSYTTDYEGTWNGLNLVGNPYSCSIDWDVIEEGLEEGVSHAIYFTRASDGSIVSWVNGVGTDEDVTSIIPPMQGFFIKTSASSTSIDLIASSDRLHGTQPRYKSGSLIPLIRMEFTDGGQPDRAVIRFDDQASNDFDDNFDAAKFLITESRNLLWSELNDKKFSINAVPFPEEEVTIKMVINVPEQGQYSLKATSIAGLDNYDIILTDMAQDNYKVDLKQTSEYTFSAEKGRIEDRFTITIGDFATGFEDIEEDKSFNIYTYANQLNIQNMSEQWNNALVDINIYDLTGRLISKHKDNEIYKGETIQLPFNRPTGIYLIEITDGTRRMVKKLSNR